MSRKSRRNTEVTLPVTSTGETKKTLQESTSIKAQALATAAYIRLSVENNGHDTDNTLKNQISLVEEYIRDRKDLFLADTYIDNGVSGTKFDRPEFVRMMEDVKGGKIQCIVVKDLSRFGRDYLETGYYLETIFPLLNVRFIAITDQYDSIREGDRKSITVPIKNMVNAMYAKDYSRKQEAFRDMCKKMGRVFSVNAPYGYRYLQERERLVIDEEVAPYVRMVFAWTLAGVERTEIAKRMNIIGAPTPAIHDHWEIENKWTDSTVKHFINNPAYAGFHVMGKSKVCLYKGLRPTRYSRDKWIYFPDYHEPYITMEEYEKINAMLHKSKQDMKDRLRVREKIRDETPDVFPGKVFCKDCGRQMNFLRGSHHRGYKDLSFQYYRCRYSKNYANCSNRKIHMNFLKIVVMDQIRLLIQAACDKNNLLKKAQAVYARPGTMQPVERFIHRMEEKEHSIDEKILQAYMDYAEGLLEEDEYKAVKRRFAAQKEETVSKKEEQMRKLAAIKKEVEQFQAMAEDLEKYLDMEGFNQKLADELVERIIVDNDGSVEVVFSCKDVFESAVLNEYIKAAEEGGSDGNCDVSEVI